MSRLGKNIGKMKSERLRDGKINTLVIIKDKKRAKMAIKVNTNF